VQGPGEYTNLDMWRVNADTGEFSNLLPADAGGLIKFSGDGSLFTISQPESIDLYNADGSVLVQDALTYEMVITYSEYYFKPRVTWGTDNSYFLTVIPSHDPMAPESAATVWRVNTSGTVEPLIVEPGNFLFGGSMEPSPDGQYVAYTTYTNDPESGKAIYTLHVKKMDGSNAEASELLGDGYVQVFGWSPDSLYFAYSFGEQGLFAGTLNLNPQPLGASQAVKEVVWVDPTTVMFSGSLNDHWGLRQAAIGGAFSDVAGPFGFDMTFDVRE
jgi:hypothetical protein